MAILNNLRWSDNQIENKINVNTFTTTREYFFWKYNTDRRIYQKIAIIEKW